jgi:hypothetical protein
MEDVPPENAGKRKSSIARIIPLSLGRVGARALRSIYPQTRKKRHFLPFFASNTGKNLPWDLYNIANV